MHPGRRSLCVLVVLALLAGLVLTGCAGSENGSASLASHGGVIGAVVGGLEHGDDEAELKEIVDRETTGEERQELREGMEAGEPPGQQGEPEPESGREQESESGSEEETVSEREQEES
jgi:hypothetical protein